jgi:hypothetical protein
VVSRAAAEKPAAPLTAADRARAWIVTGPLGRGIAFGLDFTAALGRMLRRRGE